MGGEEKCVVFFGGGAMGREEKRMQFFWGEVKGKVKEREHMKYLRADGV